MSFYGAINVARESFSANLFGAVLVLFDGGYEVLRLLKFSRERGFLYLKKYRMLPEIYRIFEESVVRVVSSNRWCSQDV